MAKIPKVQIATGAVGASLARVLAVNNYPTQERFQRVTDALTSAGARVSSISWSESSAKEFDLFDGVVLSGSPDMLSEARIQGKYRPEMDAIVASKVPVLGICFGHQMMAEAFGSKVVRDKEPVLGYVETTVLNPGGLFDRLPRKLSLVESRHEIVESLPAEFELLAKSVTSPIAAMKHRSRPLFGVQSHPERYSEENPDGGRVISNFVRLLE
jgi:GMP synthase (glutamine-hydrolysing) A subunit